MEKAESHHRIAVEPELYRKLEELAKNKSMTVDQYADFLFKDATTFNFQSEEVDPSIDNIQLTPEQYAKLRKWLDNNDTIEVATRPNKTACLLNERELWLKDHPDGKKVLGGEILQFRIPLFSPFVDFIRDYLAFFNDKQTLETFCMQAVYDKCNTLYSDLTQFAENKTHLLDPHAWYEKHSHVAITSSAPEDESE